MQTASTAPCSVSVNPASTTEVRRRKTRRFLSADESREITRRYGLGESAVELAEAYDVTRRTVTRAVQANRHILQEMFESSPKSKQLDVFLLDSMGAKKPIIAEQTGLPLQLVCFACNNLHAVGSEAREQRSRKASEHTLVAYENDWPIGCADNAEDMAELLGCGLSRVQRAIRRGLEGDVRPDLLVIYVVE